MRFGPWLKPSLDFRGWRNFAEAAEIVKEILRSLDQMLKDFEQHNLNVVYVRTQAPWPQTRIGRTSFIPNGRVSTRSVPFSMRLCKRSSPGAFEDR
jgi:hypothetical protein